MDEPKDKKNWSRSYVKIAKMGPLKQLDKSC